MFNIMVSSITKMSQMAYQLQNNLEIGNEKQMTTCFPMLHIRETPLRPERKYLRKHLNHPLSQAHTP